MAAAVLIATILAVVALVRSEVQSLRYHRAMVALELRHQEELAERDRELEQNKRDIDTLFRWVFDMERAVDDPGAGPRTTFADELARALGGKA